MLPLTEAAGARLVDDSPCQIDRRAPTARAPAIRERGAPQIDIALRDQLARCRRLIAHTSQLQSRLCNRALRAGTTVALYELARKTVVTEALVDRVQRVLVALSRSDGPSMRHGWRASSPAVGPATIERLEAEFEALLHQEADITFAKPAVAVPGVENLAVQTAGTYSQPIEGAAFHA